MAQAKTSQDKSLVNPSNQLDSKNILTHRDDYLAAAPMGIFIMSQLLICSTRVTDFPINSKIDKNKIHLLIHPESFHRTLVQIANETYEAFMLAHTNMDKIQLQMAQVPDYVKECVELLQSENKNAIAKLLPIRLKRIEEAADGELKYSTQVCEAFDRLGQLIQQVMLVIHVCAHERAKTDEKLSGEHEKQQQEIEKLKRKEIEEKKKRQLENKQREQDLFLQKEIEGAQKAVQRTQKNFEEALKLRNEDLITFCIPFLVRLIASYFNKTQAENRLQRIKQEAKQVEEEKGKICDEYMNSLKNLQNNVGKEVSTDEMIKLLQDGTKKLGELREKWAGMTMYFRIINSRIDKVTKRYLFDFAGDANIVQHDTSLLELMDESKEKLLGSFIKSHHIAVTYVKVSNNNIMAPLKRMREMLSIESDKWEETQDGLLKLCREAMRGIKDMDNVGK